jgi:DTW domain-containing protein YfiP
MPTRTRIVLLMHPKEYRYQKCTTGRLTCLNLENSEIIQGVSFAGNARVQELLHDPSLCPVVLYPGKDAIMIDEGVPPSLLGGRSLVVFLFDATWRGARAIARENPFLLALPRLMIRPQAPSRFTIKRQPAAWCLSTLEAVHELLLALETAGLDSYPDKARLLAAFDAMQDFQVEKIREAGVPRERAVRGARGAPRTGGG